MSTHRAAYDEILASKSCNGCILAAVMRMARAVWRVGRGVEARIAG
jgi:hypothetical protein